MESEPTDLSSKRKNDTLNSLEGVKKFKQDPETDLQNGLVRDTTVHTVKVENLDDEVEKDDGETDPFQGVDTMQIEMSNSNVLRAEDSDGLSEDESDSDDEDDSEDTDEESGEEDENGLMIDSRELDDEELGEEEMVLGDEDGMLGVEAVLGDDEHNGEIVMNGIENLIPTHPHFYDATNDLQCNMCYKIFARKSYLRGHSCSKDLQINNKALQCKFCNKRYSHKINLRLHLKLHNNPKQFQCHICLKYLSSSSSLKVHVKTHTTEKAFKCEYCPTAFNQKVHLNDHILSHHTKMRPFNCHLCNKTYVSKSVLKKHLKKHLGLYKYSCEVCTKRFFERSALKKHMRTHASNYPLNKLKSEAPLQCHSCLTYFHFKYKMITHQMLEHGLCRENETCYQCPLCDIKFNISSSDEPPPVQIKEEKPEVDVDTSTEGTEADGDSATNNKVEPNYPTHLNDHKTIFANLKITPSNMQVIISEHIKSHEYVENHMCELCYKVFESRENLIRHFKIHDDKERQRFKCEQCDKRFMTNADLNKHSNAIHQRLRLHECDMCGKNFSQRNNLKRHLEEVHRTDGMKFECYVCSKVLATSHSLKRHILIHNGPKYTCDICSREFTRVYELNVHKKIHEDETKANTLKCQFCGKVFLKKSNLKAHIDNNHLDYDCLECKASGEIVSFDTKKNLLLHLKTKHKNMISNAYLTCVICFKTFLNEADLGRHMRMHSDDNQIYCQFCRKYFSRNYNLKMHMKTCTKNSSNGILTCSDNEADDEDNNGHNSGPDSSGQDSNEHESDADVSQMLVPEIKMEYKEEINYSEGEENNEQKWKPIEHVKTESDPLSVADIISAGEVSITPIPRALPTNSEPSDSLAPNRIIQCHICLKTFAKRDSLKKHMKVFHTYISPDVIKQEPGGEKQNFLEVILQDGKHATSSNIIQCKICNKTFTRKDSLRKHMRKFHIISDTTVKKEFTEGEINRNMLEVILKESGHEIKSRIPCDLCYKTFTRKDSLRKHMKIFHTRRNESVTSPGPLRPQPHPQLAANKDIISTVKVENPVENGVDTSVGDSETPIERIPCSLCDKTFTRKDSLKKHTRIFHTQNQSHHSVLNNILSEKDRANMLANAAFIDRIRCELCDKSFTRKDSLKKHNKIFHGGADPKVLDEQMATGSAEFLEVVLNENEENPAPTTNEILCRICNRTFTRNYNLKKHMKTVHKIDDDDTTPYFMYENFMQNIGQDEEEMEQVEQFGSLSNSMLEVIINEDH